VAPDDDQKNSSSNHPSWSLMEIKSGVEVARHDLSSRPYTLIGRDADACHVVLQHESCSRLHARIAFDNGGVPWLRDLSSTHGTTVNKRKLPAAACGKQEESATCTKPGARGVVLYPSDVLQLGASTRLYCLQGPEVFARGAQQLLQKQRDANQKSRYASGGGSGNSGDNPAAAAAAVDSSDDARGYDLLKQQKQKAQEKEESSGVSWGIDMDDHHQDDEDESPMAANSLLLDDESKIPERHRKEWDRLRALRYKLENVKEESSRILRKGPREDLTEGQERQLVRNQEREASLQLDIQEKEAVLYRKIFPDQVLAASSSSSSQRQSRYTEEDEVEDRTGEEARRIQEGLLVAASGDRRNNTNDEAEDEQSLRAKRSLLLEKQGTIQARLAQAQETSSMLKSRINRLQAAGDGEEVFFVQNDLDIATEAISKAQKEQAAVQKLLAQTERWLKIVNPKIDFHETTPTSSSATMADLPAADLMPAPSIMPPPPPPPAIKREQSLMAERETEPDATYAVAKDISRPPPMPPPKRPRVLGPSMPPPPPSMSTKATDATPVDQKRPRPKGSTLDILSASLSSSSSASHVSQAHTQNAGTSVKSSTSTSNSADKASAVALTLDDDKHDQWVKPKDQDGSGMTKLNKKFAGRY
jgi:pSer/pThr/pTyr-binding forkhead associated (FHA) protein